MGILIVLIVIIAFLALFSISIYNSLVKLRNQVKNAWSQIDVQLKRRHDLIPNLIETVKGYMTHERDTLENITKARSQAVAAEGVGDKAKAEGELTSALGKFNLVVEKYRKHFVLPVKSNRVVTYQNSAGKKIAALLNYTNTERRAPVVILPPAFGKKKETLSQIWIHW